MQVIDSLNPSEGTSMNVMKFEIQIFKVYARECDREQKFNSCGYSYNTIISKFENGIV